MRVLPSGSNGLLVELEHLDEVLALYTALTDLELEGVVDIVPAGRTILLAIDPDVTELSTVERAVRSAEPRHAARESGELVEIPVVYDGEDLEDVAGILGCDVPEVIRRHTADEWTVAFCGFAPGFAYITAASGAWQIPRRTSPRTSVPAGSVGLAAEFSGIYPQASPGGWQLIGHTEIAVFEIDREPPALLSPGTPVRFVAVEPS
jgi:KipI family sensor histidine kinase inhibitor